MTPVNKALDRVNDRVYSTYMKNTEVSTVEIYFRTDRNGKTRAYRVSRMQLRSFPIGYEKARLMIETGQAVNIAGTGSILTGSFWKAI